ncbi:MAG: hypothetical protein ACNA8W_04460 [Bradymonadaceae bacterium]
MRRGHYILLMGVLTGLLIGAAPSTALAQSCCGSTQSTGLGRLGTGQQYLIGVDLQYKDYHGHFDGRTHRSIDGDIREIRQTIFGTMRLGRDFQLGAAVPFIQNHKDFGALSEWGVGPGDVSASLRYELVQTGLYRRLPGIGLSLTSKFPTGRSIFSSMDRAESALQADVTGTGSYDVGASVQLEWTRRSWFFGLGTGLQYAIPFTSEQGHKISRGPILGASLSAGYALYAPLMADDFLYLSLATAVDHSSGLHQDGLSLVQGAERRTTTTFQLGGFISPHVFAGLRFAADLPVDGLGENLLSSTSVGLVFRRVFYE